MALIESLENQRVVVTFSLFGQQHTVRATLRHYDKPFVEFEICHVTRIFNENTIKEIVPMGEKNEQ
jgi:hypothetical protein